MNEELQTINSELQTRLDDLALAQSDMQNLLNSTDIATLFLDNDLNVRRYTEKAVDIFHLREVDVGRPLSDLTNILSYPDLQADVKATLLALTPCTKSVAASDGRWFSVRIMPYRTLANAINGAVLTFVDISTAKAPELSLRESQLPAPTTKETP
jgi:two-component system CheB/CheR fusion protein